MARALRTSAAAWSRWVRAARAEALRPAGWSWLVVLSGALALLAQPGSAQIRAAYLAPDSARGHVSEAQLRYFLSRALTLQGAIAITPAARRQLLPWAGRLGTRFAGRVGGFWYTPESDAQEQAWYDSTRRAVALLRAAQPDIVVQGAVFELVYAHVSNLTVPNRLRAEFGEDTLHPAHRRFRLADIVYPGYFAAHDSAHYRWDSRPPGQAPGTPDMSRPEAQLWFYFCARRQLDAGCEALHFGQVEMMDHRDPGHRGWWSMLTRVRRYARARNRGFVLCDAHTLGQYFDPDPAHPLPDSARQLLFDFHATPLRPYEADTVRQGTHAARLDRADWVHPGVALYGLSAGGRTPSGWRCRHLPGLVEFDNGIQGVFNKPGQWPLVWGLDEISWFATQPRPYRTRWLAYAAARAQQLSPDTYFQPAGLRGVSVPGQPDGLYRADLDNQGDIIRGSWDGQLAPAAAVLLLVGPPSPAQSQLLRAFEASAP